MAKNILIEALRNADPKSAYLFDSNGTFISYKTGFPALDYAMGFNVNVFDESNKLVSTYPSLGITAGSIITIIGKTHVGKTTFAIQLASNIIRNFENGLIFHYDLEGGTNLTRISTVGRLSIERLKEDSYILKQSGASIEEIKMTIAKLYQYKTAHPEIFMYDTGKVDEFGQPIRAYEPTCMIIDSVPSLSTYINENTKDGVKALEEISSQTDKMRLTAEIGRFLAESMQMCKAANIIPMLINHIKTKPGMGVPQAPELRFLKQDETLPAGKALQYYTNTMIRLTSIGSEKYTLEENGFEGFGVTAQFIKNRSNADGRIVPLVFDKAKGYDSIRSSVMFAKNIGLLGGNKNGYYFINNKDKKFRFDTIHQDFTNDRELYKIMYDHIVPVLKTTLSSVKPEELIVNSEEMDYE